jgi:DNA-binding XRE family transcriptional regulator
MKLSRSSLLNDLLGVENGAVIAEGRAMESATLAANVLAARLAARLTQREAAAAADMHTAVYSRIERGEVNPRISSLMRIADALAVAPSDLLDGVT